MADDLGFLTKLVETTKRIIQAAQNVGAEEVLIPVPPSEGEMVQPIPKAVQPLSEQPSKGA